MGRQKFYSLLLILIVGCFCPLDSKISPGLLDTFVSVVGSVGKIVQRVLMRDDQISETKHVGDELIHLIPDLGGIASVFQGGDSEILDKLDILSEQLSDLSSKIDDVREDVKRMPNVIELSIFQQEVVQIRREINNCYRNFQDYTANPLNLDVQMSVKKCVDIKSYVRETGDILKGDSITFNIGSVYQTLIDKTGYCNGTELNSFFRYVYGLYIKGCASLLLAENLKYPHSAINDTEYTAKLGKFEAEMNRVYLHCGNNYACEPDGDARIIENIVKQNADLGDIEHELTLAMPWFYFVLIHTGHSFDLNVLQKSLVGSDKLPRTHSIALGNTFIICIWFPTQNNEIAPKSEYFQFKVPLDSIVSYTNGMNASIHKVGDAFNAEEYTF